MGYKTDRTVFSRARETMPMGIGGGLRGTHDSVNLRAAKAGH